MSTTCDVVVVGAGMSGLIAARELAAAGRDVIVVEAAPRIGGRLLTADTTLGSHVDLGGQWIGDGHRRFIALADELGATRYDMHSPTLPVIADDEGTVSPFSLASLLANLALVRIDLLSRRPGAARKRDSQTMADWIARIPSSRARRLLEVFVAATSTADNDRFSVGAFAAITRQQGGIVTMTKSHGGAQHALVAEGAGGLTERLAAGLAGRIRLDTRVQRIAEDGDGVTITTTAGTLTANQVIVTVPPPMLRDVEFVPPLPAEHTAAQENMYMGSVYKAIAIYPTPFWRERGKGHAELVLLGDDASGLHPGIAAFDTSPPGGPGHLCLLVGGPDGRSLDALDEEGRRKLLLGRLAAHLGEQVTAPVDWHEKSWHLDAWAGGGYLAIPSPGSTAGWFPLPAVPVGRIHWAGTERATDHPGYIEGAIQTGQRAAREILSES